MSKNTTGAATEFVRRFKLHVLGGINNGTVGTSALEGAIDALVRDDPELAAGALGYPDAVAQISEDECLELATWLCERKLPVPPVLPVSLADPPGHASPAKRVFSALAFACAAAALASNYVPDEWRSSVVRTAGHVVSLARSGMDLISSNPEVATKATGAGVVSAMLYAWFRSVVNPAVLALLTFLFRSGVCLPLAGVCLTLSALAAGVAYVSGGARDGTGKAHAATWSQVKMLRPKGERLDRLLARLKVRKGKEVKAEVA